MLSLPLFLVCCFTFYLTFPFLSTLPPSLRSVRNSLCCHSFVPASQPASKLSRACGHWSLTDLTCSLQHPGTLDSPIFLSRWLSCFFPISINDNTFCLVLRLSNLVILASFVSLIPTFGLLAVDSIFRIFLTTFPAIRWVLAWFFSWIISLATDLPAFHVVP